MASNKTGMTNPSDQQNNLFDVLVKMIGIGVAGGAFLIAAAKYVGERILEKQPDEFAQSDEQREENEE